MLIHGESGTGKELVAQRDPLQQPPRRAAVRDVNCAAIPETLLESVLFGHVKGAFTGASFDKLGEFQKATAARCSSTRSASCRWRCRPRCCARSSTARSQPLGSNKPPERVDVRLVCATNRDLRRDGATPGTFRDDLYYRLGVMTLELPPLRTYKRQPRRAGARFLEQAVKKHHLEVRGLSLEALALLRAYDYPGNVRELKNAVEHAAIMARDETIAADDLPPSIRGPSIRGPATREPPPDAAADTSRTLKQLRETWLAPLERRYLAELLAECNGNVRKAADRARGQRRHDVSLAQEARPRADARGAPDAHLP